MSLSKKLARLSKLCCANCIHSKQCDRKILVLDCELQKIISEVLQSVTGNHVKES